MLCFEVFTTLSQRTGVGRVWISVVITKVFGNIVACQLGHDVGDVAKRTQVLQAFVSTPLWKKACTIHYNIIMNRRKEAHLLSAVCLATL